MALERSSSADVADFIGKVQKYDECLYSKFSKDYKNKYMNMNYWREVADKSDMIPDQAAFPMLIFILSDHSGHMETT